MFLLNVVDIDVVVVVVIAVVVVVVVVILLIRTDLCPIVSTSAWRLVERERKLVERQLPRYGH